ncbi:MAG: hypothetical protein LBF63_02215 [Treponema sp.]|jgi:hypothetical protein|nr:hypothetical protein [Treponema sp.]
MAKKEKAIYAPGELSQVRKKLGVTDELEARRMAKLLGGEVGVERNVHAHAPVQAGTKPASPGKAAAGGSPVAGQRPKHRVELAFEEETDLIKKVSVRRPADPSDDPLIPVKASYFERIKMDRFCALSEFKIKSAAQAFMAALSFLGDAPDLVNPSFINKKLNNYYKTVERLVTSVRTLFPRNNTKRNEKLKRASPFAYSVLDVLRYWNLEKMASDIAKVQAHPRDTRITELSDILKNIYRPLFVLEQLDLDEHIKASFKLLYRILYVENPVEAKEKFQGLIREVLIAFNDVRRDIHYYLYPLLMKLLSDRYLSYDVFFSSRRNRFMDFIGASESDQINPADMTAELKGGKEFVSDNSEKEQEDQKGEAGESVEADPGDPEQIERREKEAAGEKERKAMLQGIACLEALFPRAGWERLSGFPDIYPYFRDIYNLKKGYELIAPADPLLQIVVIMRILEDMLLGLRNVRFGTVVSGTSGPIRVDEALNSVIGDWQSYINIAVEKEYLSRLIEYCRIIDQSESRTSTYAKRLLCEIHWIKRLFFLPYYKFDSIFPPPVQKKDIEQVYPAIRSLRRNLTLVASGIEQANRIGGADKVIPCDGIDNPWEAYNFAISNPVSTRLDSLLPAKRRNNATLIFFSLAFSTVLDHLVNDENSWAYRERQATPFRTVNGLPQFGVDKEIDAEEIFKESVRQREQSEKEAAGSAEQTEPSGRPAL